MNSSSLKLSLVIYLSLLVLLGVTVGVSQINLGAANIPIAIVIAGAKALLVLLFFMNLRNLPAVRIAVAAVVVFLVIVMILFGSDFFTRLGST